MTREEAIKIINNFPVESTGEREAVVLSIKALEQEPCEDCISRQVTLDGIEELKRSPWATERRNGFEYLIKEALEVVADLCVKQAQPVAPKPKMGEWLCSDDIYAQAVCSLCKENLGEPFGYAKKYFKYCPNCGAKNGIKQ